MPPSTRGEQDFLAICAHLPSELKNDLNAVADLNESTHNLTSELSRDQAEILERAKAKYRQMKRPDQLDSFVDEPALQRARDKRLKVEHGVSEKVSITKRMYDALDNCIKNIDEEIDRLEKDVKESYGVMPDFASLAPEVAAEAKKNELEAAAAAAAAVTGLAAGGVLPAAGTAAHGAIVGAAAGAVVGGVAALGVGSDGSARRDDTIGANEPVYCVCRQVGWGDMIGCDNEDCEHGEWFHYHCVGLENVDQKELSFWLCPGCSADVREKERRAQLEAMKAANSKTAAVKVAAVKLPEDGEGEEDDAGGETGEGGKGGAGKGEGRNKLVHDKTIDRQAGAREETRAATGGPEAGAGKRSESNQAPGRESKREDTSHGEQRPSSSSATGEWPKEAMADGWEGLGGLGSNALPELVASGGEGPGVIGEGARKGPGRGIDGSVSTNAFVVCDDSGTTLSATATDSVGDAGDVAEI